MDNLAKPTNRALFLVSVAVTGALAGAAVWGESALRVQQDITR